MTLPSLSPLFDDNSYDAAVAAVQRITINAVRIQTRPRLYWMLVILGAHSAIVDQKWTEQGREIKLIAIKMFKILIKNIQKNMIYVPIDP